MTLTIKVDGENLMELPLMGNVELLIEDRTIWKTEEKKVERETFVKGEKVRVKYLSYQDYKIVHGIVNNNKQSYNNIDGLSVGDILTFSGYSNLHSSCPDKSYWCNVKESTSAIIELLLEKI